MANFYADNYERLMSQAYETLRNGGYSEARAREALTAVKFWFLSWTSAVNGYLEGDDLLGETYFNVSVDLDDETMSIDEQISVTRNRLAECEGVFAPYVNNLRKLEWFILKAMPCVPKTDTRSSDDYAYVY